jgi:hypothetical protein
MNETAVEGCRGARVRARGGHALDLSAHEVACAYVRVYVYVYV